MCIFDLASNSLLILEKGMESFMRVRNRPGAAEMLAAHPDLVISDPTNGKGNGTNYLEMINQSILRLVWEKDSSSLEWQKPILKSIILE